MLRVLAPFAHHDADVAPVATSWRVTCEPRKPLAPMTSLAALTACLRTSCSQSRRHRQACRAFPPSCTTYSGLQEAQRVVDVFLTRPLAVAGVGDDRDVRRADDGAVAGIAHRVVQLADDSPGRLVDHRPQRRERGHVAPRERRHGLPDPGAHLVAALHGARRVLDVVDVLGVMLDPLVPVLGSRRHGRRSARTWRMRRRVRRG